MLNVIADANRHVCAAHFSKFTVILVSYISFNILHVVVRSDDVSIELQAGQYVKILCDDGKLRAFSVASMPNKLGYLEFYIRKKDYILSTFEISKTILVSGPYGDCIFESSSESPILLLAQGIAVSTFKSSLDLFDSTNEVYLLSVGCNDEKFVYQHDLLRWRSRISGFSYSFVDLSSDWLLQVMQVYYQKFLSSSVCYIYIAGSYSFSCDIKQKFQTLTNLGKVKIFSDV